MFRAQLASASIEFDVEKTQLHTATAHLTARTLTAVRKALRDAGAKEVHMRISSPPTTHSCFYGVDTPERSKLLASHMNVEQMAEFIGADTLAFLSVDGMYRAVGELKRNPKSPQYCDACFTGEYPIDIVDGDEITSCNTIKHAKLA